MLFSLLRALVVVALRTVLCLSLVFTSATFVRHAFCISDHLVVLYNTMLITYIRLDSVVIARSCTPFYL
jgi:hypothetical protein